MGALSITNFGGMFPLRERTLLPDNRATDALNLWPYGGDLRGVTLPKLVHTSGSSAIKSVYRIPTSTASDDMTASTWMEFTDPDTNVCRNPVLADQYERFYWASPTQGAPKMNTKARIIAGQAAFDVGVPVPDKALILVTPSGEVVDGDVVLLPGQTKTSIDFETKTPVTAGDTTTETTATTTSYLSAPLLETRSYLYTYVTAFGEEGPPSPASTGDGGPSGEWICNWDGTGSFAAALARGVTKIRLYRTVTSALGAASFIKVVDIDIPSVPLGLSYFDSLSDSAIASNPILPSTSWVAPPDLEGMVTLANGILAGWKGSDVYFCEPYRPHAWPAEYSITVEHQIVGIGVYAQSLVLCTVGNPVIISGVRPATMSTSKVPKNLPCLSRGSIVSTPNGVTYATTDGLVQITQGGISILTQELYSREQWRAQSPRFMRAGKAHGTAYLSFVCDGQPAKGQSIEVVTPQVGVTRLGKVDAVDNVLPDVWTDETLIVAGGKVFKWDPQESKARLPYRWISKSFQYMKQNNFAAAKIYFNPTEDETISTAVGNWGAPASELTLGAGVDVLFRMYADDRLVLERPVEHGKMIRLPSGFKAEFWRVEVIARTEIFAIHFASSAKELARV